MKPAPTTARADFLCAGNEDVKADSDEVARASCEDEDVPDGVGIWSATVVEERASRVGDAARDEPRQRARR